MMCPEPHFLVHCCRHSRLRSFMLTPIEHADNGHFCELIWITRKYFQSFLGFIAKYEWRAGTVQEMHYEDKGCVSCLTIKFKWMRMNI